MDGRVIELEVFDVCPVWCREAHPRREPLAANGVRKHVSDAVVVAGHMSGSTSFTTVARVLHRGRDARRRTWENESLLIIAPHGYVPLSSAEGLTAAIAQLAGLK